MSKDLLNRIRAGIDNKETPEPVKKVETEGVEKPEQAEEILNQVKEKPAVKVKPVSKKELTKQVDSNQSINGLEELQGILKAEKEGFTFNRRLVYIDDNIGDALDLLRRKAKINSNVLASYLLKKFLLENKELIKSLTEKKKDNIFLD